MQKKCEKARQFMLTNTDDFKKLSPTKASNLRKFFTETVTAEKDITIDNFLKDGKGIVVSFDDKTEDCVLILIVDSGISEVCIIGIVGNQSYENISDTIMSSAEFLYEKCKELSLDFSILSNEAVLPFWEYFFNVIINQKFKTKNLGNNEKKMSIVFNENKKTDKLFEYLMQHCDVAIQVSNGD